MEAFLIEPGGYCFGVKMALQKAVDAAKGGRAYCLGRLVHNEKTLEELSRQGVETVDEREVGLSEAIDRLPSGSTVVFSAHGHDPKLEAKAKGKGLIVVDATCPFVRANVMSAIKSGRVAYIGSKGHAEAEAFLRSAKVDAFYDVKSGRLEIFGSPTSIIAQTTLSEAEIEEGVAKIQASFPEARFIKGRCEETKTRQEAVAKSCDKAKTLIVIGSSSSSNANKLLQIGQSHGILSYLSEDARGIEGKRLIPPVGIACSASSDYKDCLQCLSYVESL